MKFSNLIKDTSFVKKSVNFMITFFRALATLSLTKNEKFKTIFDKPFFDIGQVLPQSQDY